MGFSLKSKLIVVLLFSASLISCHSPQNSSVNQPVSNLANTEIEYTVETTTSEYITQGAMQASGVIIERFNGSHFFSDITDFAAGYYSGSYVYHAMAGDKNSSTQDFLLNEITFLPAISKNPALKINTQLHFNSATDGQFTSEVIDDDKKLLKQTGKFKIKHQAFSVLPKSFLHHIITLQLNEVSGSAEGLKKDAQLNLNFIDEKILNISGPGFNLNASKFQIVKKDEFTQNIEGITDDGKYRFSVALTYGNFNGGFFTLNLNGKKNVARGGFWMIKYIPSPSIVRKGQVIEDQISSKITQINYKYYVYLPPGYSGAQKKYSVIYATDGQWNKDFANYIELKAKDIIYVAIEQGPENRRSIDYGVEKGGDYIKFLKTEFIPLIESKYKVSEYRTYFGASLGGTLGAQLINDEPIDKAYFHNYIIADGAFWALTPAIAQIEKDRLNKSKKLAINLFLSSTHKGNGRPTDIYIEHMKQLNWQGLSIQRKDFNNLTHEEISGPCFDEFLDQLHWE